MADTLMSKSSPPDRAIQFNRLHIPSGRQWLGTFNASHDACFADVRGWPARYVKQAALACINDWNWQQPSEWKYWL